MHSSYSTHTWYKLYKSFLSDCIYLRFLMNQNLPTPPLPEHVHESLALDFRNGSRGRILSTTSKFSHGRVPSFDCLSCSLKSSLFGLAKIGRFGHLEHPVKHLDLIRLEHKFWFITSVHFYSTPSLCLHLPCVVDYGKTQAWPPPMHLTSWSPRQVVELQLRCNDPQLKPGAGWHRVGRNYPLIFVILWKLVIKLLDALDSTLLTHISDEIRIQVGLNQSF